MLLTMAKILSDHEFDTFNTVVKRCMHISAVPGQQHTVVTVDKDLYCKLVGLKWEISEYQKQLVVQLCCLHISNECASRRQLETI